VEVEPWARSACSEVRPNELTAQTNVQNDADLGMVARATSVTSSLSRCRPFWGSAARSVGE
jgi:hypothetical protein